jgi:hypothetical protein
MSKMMDKIELSVRELITIAGGSEGIVKRYPLSIPPNDYPNHPPLNPDNIHPVPPFPAI